jgi:hypothetical protein
MAALAHHAQGSAIDEHKGSENPQVTQVCFDFPVVFIKYVLCERRYES